MRNPRYHFLLALTVCGLLVAADKTDEPQVDLRVAKYDEMGDIIKDLKGKIVIVDFWADT